MFECVSRVFVTWAFSFCIQKIVSKQYGAKRGYLQYCCLNVSRELLLHDLLVFVFSIFYQNNMEQKAIYNVDVLMFILSFCYMTFLVFVFSNFYQNNMEQKAVYNVDVECLFWVFATLPFSFCIQKLLSKRYCAKRGELQN